MFHVGCTVQYYNVLWAVLYYFNLYSTAVLYCELYSTDPISICVSCELYWDGIKRRPSLMHFIMKQVNSEAEVGASVHTPVKYYIVGPGKIELANRS